MTYTITQNAQYNSLEVIFDGKPSEAVRNALKALRFRWHSVKKCWYGYTDEQTAREAIDKAENGTSTAPTKKTASMAGNAAPAVNKYGVQVGDIFSAEWGYEQTNVDFFQVVQLVGACSARVRAVCLPMVDEEGISGMSANRVYKLTRELLPPRSSVFIEDSEKGDLKRLKSYADAYGGNPFFRVDSFARAYLCTGETVKTYESWYA